MIRKASSIILGALVLLNLLLFGLSAGTKPLSAELFDCQSTGCCECRNGGAGLPSICIDTFGCRVIQCRYHEQCN